MPPSGPRSGSSQPRHSGRSSTSARGSMLWRLGWTLGLREWICASTAWRSDSTPLQQGSTPISTVTPPETADLLDPYEAQHEPPLQVDMRSERGGLARPGLRPASTAHGRSPVDVPNATLRDVHGVARGDLRRDRRSPEPPRLVGRTGGGRGVQDAEPRGTRRHRDRRHDVHLVGDRRQGHVPRPVGRHRGLATACVPDRDRREYGTQERRDLGGALHAPVRHPARR